MTTITDSDISITITFDEAVQAIAYLSDLLDFIKGKGIDKAVQTQARCVETAKEICEAFCCEHFERELQDTEEGAQDGKN